MFRIKTDIRQFNCETQEKVEKLIRNWVIRPTDLIYHKPEKSWSPIGEHTDFCALFESLREDLDDGGVMSTTELDQISVSVIGEESSAVSEAQEEAEPEKPQSEPFTSMRAAILSGRGRIKKTTSEPVSSSPLPIPQAPAGVEGVASSGDEVTVMTERTAELLGLQDSEPLEEELIPVQNDALPEISQPYELSEVGDEPTNIFERSEPQEEDSGEYVLEEVAPREDEEPSEPRLGRHDLPEELFLTNEMDRPEDILAALEQLPPLDELPGDAEDAADKEAWDGAQEVTQQLESPLESSAEEVDSGWDELIELDDLREISEAPELAALDLPEDEDSRATIELDSPFSRDDLLAQAPLEDQLAADRSAEEKKPSEQIFIAEDYSRELSSSDEDELEATAEHEPPRLSEGLVAPPPSAAQSAAQSAATPDPVAELLDPTDEFPEDVVEQILGEVAHVEDFVSEGYVMPFPFAIRPTPQDLEAGILKSAVSDREKDLAFPRPMPKKLREITTRRYGYNDPPMRTPGDVPNPGVAPPREPADITGPVAVVEDEPRDHTPIVIIVGLIFFLLIVLMVVVFSQP